MAKYLTCGEAAKRLETQPRKITDLFTRGDLALAKTEVRAGRRLIPEALLPTIAARLKTAAKRSAERQANSVVRMEDAANG